MGHPENELSSLIGRELYTATGIWIGTVQDVVLDFDQGFVKGLAIADRNPDLFTSQIDADRGIVIPYRWIRAVDDIIITSGGLGDQEARAAVPSSSAI